MTLSCDLHVVVVGASGYLGRHIAAGLSTEGYKVLRLDPRVHLTSDVPRVDVVVNAAGLGMSSDKPIAAWELLDGNLGCTLWCIRLATLNAARYIHIGSAVETCAEGSFDPYRESKRLAAEAVRLAHRAGDLAALQLRPQLMYGSGGKGLVDRMAWSLQKGEPWPLRQPWRRRDLVHVLDVARAVRLAVEVENPAGEEVDIGTGSPVALATVADMLAERLRAPQGWLQSNSTCLRADEDQWADVSMAERVLGFSASIVLVDGLDRVVADVGEMGRSPI